MMYTALNKTLNSKPILIPETEDIRDFIDNPELDWYESLYKYNEAQKQQIEQNNSVAGIKDTVTNKLFFDFDYEQNLEIAKKDTEDFCIELLQKYNIPYDSIQVYFSGGKGFSIVIPTTDVLTPELHKAIAIELGSKYKSFDSKVYNAVRIVRIPNTKHPKTGLYKIHLSLDSLELMTIEQIKNLAQHPMIVYPENNPITIPKSLYYKIDDKFFKKDLEDLVGVEKKDLELDWNKKPPQWKNCKWALLQGKFGADQGERHHALLVLAATCKGLGFDKETTYYMCKSALKKQAEFAGREEFPKEELWENIIQLSTFGDHWQGGQFSCKNDPWLKSYCESLGEHKCKNEDEVEPPRTFNNLIDPFKTFVKNIDKNTITTGLPSLDANVFMSTGANIGIIGAAASGKSSLALNILNHTSRMGIKAVFASLDMSQTRIMEKLLYRVSGYNRERLYKTFHDDQEQHLIEKINKEFGNVFFFNKSTPTVKDIKNFILHCQEMSKEKIKVVVLDYFERVSSDFSDDTQGSKRVAGELQDLVNELDICLITLVQPNKNALSGGIDAPIYDYTAIKGSSFIYQAFRIILSIWRPFATPQYKDKDKFLKMAVLKNDLGELNEFLFSWNGKQGIIEEASEEQEYLFKQWNDQKEREQNQTDDWE